MIAWVIRHRTASGWRDSEQPDADGGRPCYLDPREAVTRALELSERRNGFHFAVPITADDHDNPTAVS